MAGTELPGGIYRQEALDNYARPDRHDAAPSFDPSKALPRWSALIAGTLALAAFVIGGLTHQVQQGSKGILVDVADDSVIVAFTSAPPLLVGEPIRLILSGGAAIGGTAVDTEQVSGDGLTGTMVLVELDVAGAASGRNGESVTIDAGQTPLLINLFDNRGAR